jgi:hypothetical protein
MLQTLPSLEFSEPAPGYARLLAQNYDWWGEAFDIEVSKEMIEHLDQAQAQARAAGELGDGRSLVHIGDRMFQMRPFGGSGARWILDSGEIEIAVRPPAMRYPISARLTSAGLWQFGRDALRAELLRCLSFFGQPREARNSSELGQSWARLTRVDYAFDWHSPAFTMEMRPELCEDFVVATQTKKAIYGRVGAAPEDATAETLARIARTQAKRDAADRAFAMYLAGADGNSLVETFRVGSLPRLQVEIYEKSRELAVSGKEWLRELWQVDGAPIDGDVWRIECRFGSEHLKSANLRTIESWDAAFHEALAGALISRRLTVGDATRRRRATVHPLWTATYRASGAATAAPALGRRTTGRARDLQIMIARQVAGLARAYSVLEVNGWDEKAFDAMLSEAVSMRKTDKRHAAKVDAAIDRYALIDRPR